MRKQNKVVAFILSLVFIVTLIQPNIFAKAESKSGEKVYVKIRYSRPDSNYEGWNLWVWEKDKEGKQVDFLGEDSEGKFAVIETNTSVEELGFIIRKSVSGNDWAENYFGVDKFVKPSEGDTEIVVNHVEDGEKTLEKRDIKRDFEKLTLNLHYFRFDNNYNNWDIWSWMEGKDGAGYPLTFHEFGNVSKIEFANVVNGSKIGFLVRRPDWSDKDIDSDRFVNIAYANNDGVINAYIGQSDPGVYYYEKDVVKDPKVVSLKMDSLRELSFKTNFKLPSTNMDGKFVLKEEGIPMKASVTIPETLTEGIVTTERDMDLTKTYTLEIEGFKAKDATLGKIYGSKDFEKAYHYSGELGANYSKEKTNFVLWAPTAEKVELALYGKDGREYNNKPVEVVEMAKGEKGIWTAEKTGDLTGEYYNYLVTVDGSKNEVTDPYAKSVGVNGNRGMVIDLASTNPEGWEEDKKPELKDATDSVIYEMHIRDFSIDDESGVTLEYKGKYNGVWQEGTTIPGTDVKTGVDHLKELGITTVHLLPTFDHRSIDETKLDKEQYNWGYDPQNYNAPEGSYSSDPYEAEIRIKEFKEMVMELHKAGIRVVMDVVYNHTGATADSHLNKAVPDYYYRQNINGGFSNGSGCGNEVASERSMVRRMIVDSVVYWANEYNIDGFRFDLMGLHDIETMKQVREELNKIDKSIIIYGEGWTGGDSPLPSEESAIKVNTEKYGDLQIAAFSDDIRDGIKGHVFNDEEPAFVNGKGGFEDTIKFGVVAATNHPQVNYDKINYSNKPWANEPYQTVTYASAHDNFTLWDKLQTTNKNDSKEQLLAMNKMSAAIVLTSQGIPFIHAGEEFARTKVNPDGSFNHNSYNAPDSVNKMDWERKEEYKELFDYYKGLIELRKSHKAFRMNSTEDIQKNINFLDVNNENVVAYTLKGKEVGDSWNEMVVLFNANEEAVNVTIPNNKWVVVVNEKIAGVENLEVIEGTKITLPAKSTYVLVDKASFDGEEPEEIIVSKPEKLKTSNITKTTVDLTWEAPQNTVGLVGYVIYKDGKEITTIPSNITEYKVNELKANTIYGFKVTAKYSNNEESKPKSVNARTKK